NTKNLQNPYIYINKLSGYIPTVDVYGYLNDLTGEQVIKLDLNTEEGLIKNINMNKYLFLGIFLLYFIIIGFTWYFLYDNFISRINHILKSISKLKNNGSKLIEDEIETNDELEIVEKKIESLVDKLNNHYDEIMYSANSDYLTNLYNRVGFNREIKKYIQDTNNENAKAALLFLDIDKFKNINDVYGHNIGDEVLKRFARRLFDNAPRNSIVARTSGDEFIMLIKKYESKEDIQELVSKLLKYLNRPYIIEDYKIKSTASIGIAFYPESSDNIEEIIVQADAAMYNVKKNGRNNFTEYQSEMKNIISGISITNAIDNKEFYLEYQPQINAKTGALVGIESLLRWNSPTLGFIPPNKFISIAEDTGTINELGQYVIEEVFKKVREWQDKGYKIPKTSINISPIQLINKNLSKDVMKLINKYSLNADNIVFEITENIAIGNQHQIFENLNHLHVSGISIFIDDFGKGYSALNYLEELPISGVKIDKSFVDQIEKNDKIVKMVFALSKALNLDVVVEGVETEVQKEIVCQMGGCVIQGYL
ncbi:MAG: putative bifunctional diguanylate cyclase/phosphodiesterase, partial [Peptostreptococcaceae bacterium]